MSTLQVKIQLLKTNLTEQKIADRLKVSQSLVHFILSGKTPGYAYRKRISLMLGMPEAVLFPDNGKPKRKTGAKGNKTRGD